MGGNRTPRPSGRPHARPRGSSARAAILALLCSTAAAASMADGGLRIDLDVHELAQGETGRGGGPEPTTGWIQGRRLTLLADESWERRLIFDGESPGLLAVDESAGTYSELTAGTLDLLATGYHRRIEGLAQELEERIAALPRERRAHAERELRAQIERLESFAQPKPIAPLQIEPTAEQGRFDGLACTWHRVHRDGVVVRELCTVDPRELGLEENDLQVTRDVGAFSEELASKLPTGVTAGMGGVFVGWQLTDELPLAVRWYEHGEAMRRTEVRVEITEAIDPDLLSVPRGLRRAGMLNVER